MGKVQISKYAHNCTLSDSILNATESSTTAWGPRYAGLKGYVSEVQL